MKVSLFSGLPVKPGIQYTVLTCSTGGLVQQGVQNFKHLRFKVTPRLQQVQWQALAQALCCAVLCFLRSRQTHWQSKCPVKRVPRKTAYVA